MSNWQFDISKTKKRYSELQNFYKSAGLNADSFFCLHGKECRDSQKSDKIVPQFRGGTAALMPFYDVKYKGFPIRVLIIGKENAYMRNKKFGTSDNFQDHSINVLNCINWSKKNNHIKGTLITLKKIYNVDSEYIYSSYALTNLLRCSYQYGNKIDVICGVHDTAIMRNNCREYLLKEIEILEPTIIVAQGNWSTHSKHGILAILSHKYGEPECLWLCKSNPIYGLYKFDKILCIVSHHPAILGHWEKNLAPSSLWPAISYLQVKEFLPTIDERDATEYEKNVQLYVDTLLHKNKRDNNDLRRK